ncbi:mechanosensitive ion channel family protein [Natronobiforma cellulositropha]|uniref:mechanosensitive ion channel family protein n=1 Tax=Natronobiforma cellulositropha TaxID=1679076 RepID=UPI0021D5A7B4|nr:mechanosensitive ion channel family protein [Natronobiforma cellulositropha]
MSALLSSLLALAAVRSASVLDATPADLLEYVDEWLHSLPSRLESLLPWLDAIPDERVWLSVTVLLVGSYLLAKLVHWASKRYLERSGDLTETSIGWAVFEEVHTPVALSIGFFGVYLSVTVLGPEESPLASVVLSTLLTVLVLLWARAAIRVGSRWIEIVNARDIEYEFAPMFKNLWKIGVVVAAGLLLLSIWRIEVTPFLASAGILGIVIGFAAQDAISNLIGGVALYFDNTYKLGDVILLEDDMRGTVTDIGVRSTTVLTTDNVLVTVPNAVLNSTQVVNETAPQRHIRLRIPITAAYGTDYHEVERILLEVCDDAPLIRASPPPRVLFREFGDSALVFELRAYISHPLSEWRAVDQVNRGVDDAFAEAGITIPFPQRELSFLEDAPPGTRVHEYAEPAVGAGGSSSEAATEQPSADGATAAARSEGDDATALDPAADDAE